MTPQLDLTGFDEATLRKLAADIQAAMELRDQINKARQKIEAAITASGYTYLGRIAAPAAPAGDAAALHLAVDALSPVMPIETTDDFAGAQWTKLLVNHVNALPAITGLSVQQTIADPRLRAVLLASMTETIGIARAKGVHFAPVQGLDERLLRFVQRAPRILAQLVPRAMARRMGSTPNPGSTLQSIRRGQLTEIDHLNGAVVAAAATLSRPAPVNATLVTLVHAVEHDHRFRTPTEVAAALHPRS